MYVQEKVIIVTGGVGKIGLSTVQYLLRNGAKFVAIFDLFKSDHKVVINSMKALEQEFSNEKFNYYTCNISNHEEFIASFDEVTKLKNYVDVVINNAEILNENTPDLEIDTNFKAVLEINMFAIERMGKHKCHKGGVIINIASTAGIIGSPSFPVYSATKAAIIYFVRSLEQYNQNFGVRIMCLCPQLTKTNVTDIDSALKKVAFFASRDEPIKAIEALEQKPESVASAIIKMLEKGKGGTIWVVQMNERSFPVRKENYLEVETKPL